MRDFARNIIRCDSQNDDVCFFVWIYKIKQVKLKVGRCFGLISNQWGFDLFDTGRSHFLLSDHSLSFNNAMITLTSPRWSARIVELASGQIYIQCGLISQYTCMIQIKLHLILTKSVAIKVRMQRSGINTIKNHT